MADYLSFMLLALLLAIVVFLFVRKLDHYNETDWGYRWLNRVDGLIRWYCYRMHRLQHTPLDLPEGPVIVVANHISGLDPFFLLTATRRPLRFLIAREEYERFGLKWIFKAAGCIPVDRETKPHLALRAGLQALEAGEAVALFPHAGIQRPGDPVKKLKAGAARLAEKTGADIYVVLISGVGLPGHTVSCFLVPSRAKLEHVATLNCEGKSTEECLHAMAQILNK